MSIVYNNKFVKVYKENFFYKKKKVKNFHRVFLNNAVMAIVINPNKEILLTKEYRRGVKKIMYGFPGGHINKKENPLAAIKREVFEETGLRCGSWKKILTYVKDTTYFCGRDYLFVCRALRLKNLKNQSGEIENLFWVNISTFEKILKNKDNSAGFIASSLFFLKKNYLYIN
jgi:8-oxo-dGTP pyrophosphatase MutT (NUDIX family)